MTGGFDKNREGRNWRKWGSICDFKSSMNYPSQEGRKQERSMQRDGVAL
jgi:hypothetical protein